jgi:hypothetical protein
MTLDHIVKTMTLDHIVAAVILDTIVAFDIALLTSSHPSEFQCTPKSTHFVYYYYYYC